MTARIVTSAAMLLIGTAFLLGCPQTDDGANGGTNGGNGNGTDGNGDGGTARAITGTWSGEVTCTITQTLEGNEGPPQQTMQTITISYDANGRPDGVIVPGFSDADDQTAQLSEVGDSVTLNSTQDTGAFEMQITQTVTVREAEYTSDSARVVLDIVYDATGGALTQEGTATVTTESTVDGDTLTYSSTTVFDIMQNAAGIMLSTGQRTVCQGELQRQ